MRFKHLALLLLAALLSGCGSRTTSSPSQELEQLKGTWQVVALEAGGNPVPAERVRQLNLQWVFDGDRVTIRRPDRPENASTFSVDAAANPKKMIIGNPPARAIYAVDGNKLQICLVVDENANAGHPTAFASQASPKTDLITLERSSAAKAPAAQAPPAPQPGTQPPPTPPGGTLYVYSQSTGKLTLNDQLVAVGYSGKGPAKNNPSKQAEKDGPIPLGEYMFSGYRDDPKVGAKIMGLLPVAGGNYFNRFPSETFAIIAQSENLPSGCFIVVPGDTLQKLSTTPVAKVQVVK